MSERHQINIRISEKLKTALDSRLKLEGLNQSKLVILLLEEALGLTQTLEGGNINPELEAWYLENKNIPLEVNRIMSEVEILKLNLEVLTARILELEAKPLEGVTNVEEIAKTTPKAALTNQELKNQYGLTVDKSTISRWAQKGKVPEGKYPEIKHRNYQGGYWIT